MSFEMRNNTAMFKRAEQLRRWEESDTAREPDYPKNEAGRRIKFSSGCVFLAACLSGERDEVLRLLEQGADIDTANTDGLTALHQACIDDNLEMVEFLVHNGADVNRQDNEGWTPLHATASCGFLSIARYLIESGANLASVSSDGELVVDLADNDRMEQLLRKTIDEQGIDCDEARQSEERLMLNDAKNWLRSDASEADKPHPRTGATALHVAAAKGYSKVLSLLLATRSDVDKQDNDGWTPLHAAAHWGQKDAAQMLVAALADMDIKNYAGQTIFEVADSSILRFLEELKKNNKRNKRRPASQIRISDGLDNHIDTTPSKVIRVEVKSAGDNSKDVDGATTCLEFLDHVSESGESDHDSDDAGSDSTESSHSTSLSDTANGEEKPAKPTDPAKIISKDIITVPEEDTPWRRSGSLRSRQQPDSPPKNTLPASPEKETSTAPASTTTSGNSTAAATAHVKVPQTAQPQSTTTTTESEVILRRTQSFENDEKFYQKYQELRARIKANSCPALPANPIAGHLTGSCGVINTASNNSTSTGHSNHPIGQTPTLLGLQSYLVQRSASLKDHRQLRKTVLSPVVSSPVMASSTNTPTTTATGQVRRSAAEELVRSQFNAFRNVPSPGIQLERQFGRQTRHGGSTQSLNKMPDAVQPLSAARNATSITDLPSGGGGGGAEKQRSGAAAAAPASNMQRIAGATVSVAAAAVNMATPAAVDEPAAPTSARSKFAPGQMFKNFFKSFVPPSRDEESETQRKAHAKRVRETRRSTQGVTLDEIKSAEELIKKNNMNNNNNSGDTSATNTTTSATTTTTTTTTTLNDRVPSHKPTPTATTEATADELLMPPPAPPTSSASSLDPSPIQITASYTITAPPPTPTSRTAAAAASATSRDESGTSSISTNPSKTHEPTSTVNNDDSKVVSATFTMPSPTSAQPPSPFGRKLSGGGGPSSPLRSHTTPPGTPTSHNSSAITSITATINVPSAATLTAVQTKAADLEATFKAKSSPTTSPLKLQRLRSTESPSAAATATTVANNEVSSTTATTISPTIAPASHADFTLHRVSAASSATKRSLFDLDNASSLSLADKLRNEANKYSETADADRSPAAATVAAADVTASGTVIELSPQAKQQQLLQQQQSIVRDSTAANAASSAERVVAAGGGSGVVAGSGASAERRPSWRLKFDSGSKFKLEDVVVTLPAPATDSAKTSSVSATGRTSSQSSFEPAARPVSSSAAAAIEQSPAQSQVNDRVRDTTTATGSTTTTPSSTNSSSTSTSSAGSTASSNNEVFTLPLRRSKATDEDKENDKENDSRSAQATQAVIQRRRRPKRRSTGVVHVDMDDIDPDRQDGADGVEDKESGSERTSRSRLGSTSSMVSDGNDLKSDSTENGDHIDYKALYEAAKLDNDKLKQQLKKKDEDLSNAKATVDRFANATTKNSLSELEKRERRAMERKLSEMEEELKHLEALKTENQRLKDENGALIRVISKLSK